MPATRSCNNALAEWLDAVRCKVGEIGALEIEEHKERMVAVPTTSGRRVLAFPQRPLCCSCTIRCEGRGTEACRGLPA